jgi:hypothetical protein
MLWQDRYGFNKKRVGTCYAKLVFLHQVQFAGHVVDSGASGAPKSMHYFSSLGRTSSGSTKSVPGHVMPNMYFCMQWDLWVT